MKSLNQGETSVWVCNGGVSYLMASLVSVYKHGLLFVCFLFVYNKVLFCVRIVIPRYCSVFIEMGTQM